MRAKTIAAIALTLALVGSMEARSSSIPPLININGSSPETQARRIRICEIAINDEKWAIATRQKIKTDPIFRNDRKFIASTVTLLEKMLEQDRIPKKATELARGGLWGADTVCGTRAGGRVTLLLQDLQNILATQNNI